MLLILGRQVATVAGGAAAGQLITLVATPWLTRVYSPTDFGVYAAFASMCGVFLAVGCLRFDAAIAAVADEELRGTIVIAGVACLSLALVGAAFTATEWGGDALSRVVGPHITPWRVGVAALLCAGYQLATSIAIREGRFARSALLRFLQPAVFVAAAIGLPFGLIDSHLLGFGAAVPLAAYAMVQGPAPGIAALRAILFKYREFVLVSLPTSLLDALSVALPVWVIAASYSAQDTGHYSLVQRLLSAPSVLLAMAAGQVFLKRAGDVVRAGESPRALLRITSRQLLALSALVLATVWLFGDPVLSVVLGSGWRTDPAFLLLAFLPAAIRSAVSPVTGIFVVRGRLRVAALWQISYFTGTAIMFFVLAGSVSLEMLLLAFCVTESLFYAWYLWLADRVAG